MSTAAAAARSDIRLPPSPAPPPTPRSPAAWPLDTEASVENFAANLDFVARRFDEAKFDCPALPREHIDDVTRGAIGMWCAYLSADGLDLLEFRLRTIDGRGQVEYVGMFETPPTSVVQLAPNEPAPPAMAPSPTEVPRR